MRYRHRHNDDEGVRNILHVTDMMFAFVLVWNMMEYDRHVHFIHHILLVPILSRPKNFWIFVDLYYVNTQTS